MAYGRDVRVCTVKQNGLAVRGTGWRILIPPGPDMTEGRSLMQKALRELLGRVAVALLVLLTPTAAIAQDAVTWKAVSNTRNSAHFTEKWKWFADEMKARTEERVSVQVSSFPELGLTGQELIRVLNANLVDIAEVVTGYVSGDVPLMEGVQLPGVFETYEQSQRGYQAWMDQVVSSRQGVLGGKPVATFAFSSQYLWSKFPLETLDDLKGKKVRVFAAAQADFFRALGAEPVSIPLAEVYTALERGVVDAVVTGPESGAGLRLWEVLDHVSDLRLGVGAGYIVVSTPSYDRLSDADKAAFDDLLPRLNELGWSLGADDTKAGLEEVEAKGIVLTIPGKPEWQERLTEIARNVVVANWIERAGPESKEIFNTVLGDIAGFTVE